MKQTLYIHIGTHKTGTTAVQKFSAEHSKKIFQLGIYYPLISRPMIDKIAVGHHLLPWYLLEHPVPGKYYGDYNEKRSSLFPSLIADIKSSKCGNIILSSEEFDRLNLEQIKRLKKYFVEFDVKIIIYLRRKDSYVESMYQTIVVHGSESRSIIEAINKMESPLDYFTFVKKWQGVFGEKNIHINFYCKKALKSHDIVVDFYNQLGFDIENTIAKDKGKDVNSSVPFQYVAVMSMLRRMEASDEIVNKIKRLSYKLAKTANKDFHLLSLEERINLASSGLKEIEQLGLNLPYQECFMLSKDEKKLATTNKRFAALKQVFQDFEDYLDDMEAEK